MLYFIFSVSSLLINERQQKHQDLYLNCFSILHSSDSSLVQVILDTRFIKFKHKTKAHYQVTRWQEVLFAPYHEAPCCEVLSRGCCLGHLWMMYPPCWGHDSSLPCSTIWHRHASSFIQGLWRDRLTRGVLYYNTSSTVKICVHVQIACRRKKCINEKITIRTRSRKKWSSVTNDEWTNMPSPPRAGKNPSVTETEKTSKRRHWRAVKHDKRRQERENIVKGEKTSKRHPGR